MAYLSPTLTLLIAAVKKASVAVARDFNELEHLQSSVRNTAAFAARSAEKAAAILREECAKCKPNFGFVADSADSLPSSGNYFAVCPIDGFENFTHGNNKFALSLAMVENNTVTAAIVYNPISDEMFFAEKGSGAFKEGFRSHERLRVAGSKNAETALLGCSADATTAAKAFKLSPNTRISGATAVDLAYVAAGKLDAVITENAPTIAVAAGILLVKEAGGYIVNVGETDVRSEDLVKALLGGKIIATNEALRQKIADNMAK